MADLELRFPGHSEEIAALYPVTDGDDASARVRVVGESRLACGTHDTARRTARAGRPVFMYDFNVPWAIAPGLLHAGHAAEISHVFGTPFIDPAAPDADSEAVGRAGNAYWAAFAATGDPNHANAPAEWHAFAVDDDKRVQLDPAFQVLENFRSEECAFWRELAAAE